MQDNFNYALSLVLISEGGFVNNPHDPGGATMKGVTLLTFQKFFGSEKTVTDLQNISEDQLAQIYRSGYWNQCGGDQLPKGLDYAAFDCAVNSGPARSAKFLQTAVGVPANGSIDANSIAALVQANSIEIIDKVCDQRLTFLKSLDTFAVFGDGWTTRVESVRKNAKAQANGESISSGPSADHTFEIVKKGSNGPWVGKVQAALNLTVDNSFGDETEAALQAFQTAHGLTPDGIVGYETYRALGIVP